MDTRTGKIYTAEDLPGLAAHIKENLVDIPDDQLEEVQGMNRKQRRAWASKQRKVRPK